jgi:hypothetical protein
MRAFLSRRVTDPLLLLLKQGLTPEALALCALGAFGWTGLHGMLGWLTVAPLIGGALYVGLLLLLRYTARRVAPAAEPGA